jgi:hypothetical protein
MLRMRLRTAMTVVAVLAVLLGTGIGLWRRARRLEAIALQYGRDANRIEDLWVAENAARSGPRPPGEPDVRMELVHWNDTVAEAYRAAAARPWLPFDPEPHKLVCGCGFHAARRAGTTK